jgi:Protein of unknown function (DUF742)
MTGGRTGAGSHIALEAQVLSTAIGARISDQFHWEAAAIIDLAQTGTAVIELASLLAVPIGVVRVLAGDLEEMGAVVITNPAAEVIAQGGEDYTELLQKVLDGIKAL